MQHPDLAFALLVAVAAGAGTYVIFSLVNDFRKWFNGMFDARATPEQLAKRKWFNTPFNMLILGLILLPFFFAGMVNSHHSSKGREAYSQFIREEAVAKGYAVLCTIYEASYQANKEWCDHPHWVGD